MSPKIHCATQSGGSERQVPQMEQQLYAAVSSTSSWLDGVENNIFSGSVLLAENTETQIQQQEVQEGLFLQFLITCFPLESFF